jgi:hypothetical protein
MKKSVVKRIYYDAYFLLDSSIYIVRPAETVNKKKYN